MVEGTGGGGDTRCRSLTEVRMLAAILCGIALGPGFFNQHYATDEREAVCVQVAEAAIEAGHDPFLFVALAHEESRYRSDAVSDAGAIGPLQILPRYYCPNRTADGCDPVAAGIRAFERKQARYGTDLEEVLCHYNAGNTCYRRSYQYARRIIRLSDRLREAYEERAQEATSALKAIAALMAPVVVGSVASGVVFRLLSL
jgi:hypothetical protein